MIIGFDAKRVYNNFTGLGNYCRTLLHNLAEFYPGNDYYLYTPRTRHTAETAEFLTNRNFKNKLPKTKLKSLWRSFLINQDLKKDKTSIYHGLSHEIPFRIQKTGIKTVVTIHDLIFKHYPDTYGFIDRSIYDIKFRYACENADKVVAISESTKRDIVQFYDIAPEKIEVIYQSFNPLFLNNLSEIEIKVVLQQYKIPTDYLLYVGSVIERKNLLTILKSYLLLPPDLQIPLVVVGRGGAYKKQMQEYVQKIGIASRVIWLDNLDNNYHLHALYCGAQAFIYPSVFEGFGLPVVEALLSQTPVITSNVSSLPEAAGKHSLCIEPTNFEQMSAAIKTVLTNTPMREKMILEGRKYALDNFSAQHTAQQLMDLYKTLK
ncbi:Glycosyltransferase involved in cell wall bisynthesis [Flexibacter flexilis DSM 6793]|uniref:Glycosyltransferase involved in cell wall bisynthesis n=1 Tax=Flexibacter flexilis DSM 6793 TaxID=927664 RepID=A0A1I1E9X3_9BACT|nr:glycosyltransferase family 1 protein [Flexibacter flexilis]SFB82138.1 Glycosyltransferase involved in cell wall bisynthesis [Flexibacter flexilis DSM 6793]